MGDRANIQIHQPKAQADLYLYTHWSGSYINQILALGLAKSQRAGRLTDPAYATRIIFDTLTGCEGGDTGFGISVGEVCDNEHDIPLVYWPDEFGKEPVVILNGHESSVDAYITYWLSDDGKSEVDAWENDKTFAGSLAKLRAEGV